MAAEGAQTSHAGASYAVAAAPERESPRVFRP